MIRRSIAAALLSIMLIGASPPPERPLVLAFGDSLTAGYGLEQGLGLRLVAACAHATTPSCPATSSRRAVNIRNRAAKLDIGVGQR